jgi:hypothetical protein
MVATIDSIVTGFPFPTVLLIVGEPNYKSIAALHQQLNANSASFQSHLGNGLLGLLQLTVSPTVYNTLSATAFVPPVNPGPAPLIPDGLTGPQIANICFAFNAATALFKDYDLANKALKQLLLLVLSKALYKLTLLDSHGFKDDDQIGDASKEGPS